jgi:hypothetical protein
VAINYAEAGLRGFSVDLHANTLNQDRPRTEPTEPSVETETRTFLDQDVSRFFYRWGGLLSATLIDVRARFQGDLDQYLIYLIFLLDDLAREIASRDGLRRGRPLEQRGMNALSIAEITDIPRETARRKLQLLVAGGYVERGYDGLYYLGDRYGRDAFFFDLSPLFLDGLKSKTAPSAQAVQPEPQVADG